MDIIKWRKDYETGIDSMDVQHQKLIELINKLYKVIRKEESSASIKEVLNEMTKYAEQHLQDEEAMLKTNDYPDFASHSASHQGYRDKLKTLLAESKNEEDAAVKETYAFLRQWWKGHIVAEDQKYGEFLKAKGVK
ncbi:MAG: hemerythrin family protein [Desulfofustis sp.]|nr:hemerythrin family protein [Desulfofustis sp.]